MILLTEDQLQTLTAEQLKAEIDREKVLLDTMVGTLYRSLLLEDIRRLERRYALLTRS